MLSVVIVKMTIRASLGRVKPSLFSLTDCYFKFYQLRSYSKDNPSNINHGPFFVYAYVVVYFVQIILSSSVKLLL